VVKVGPVSRAIPGRPDQPELSDTPASLAAMVFVAVRVQRVRVDSPVSKDRLDTLDSLELVELEDDKDLPDQSDQPDRLEKLVRPVLEALKGHRV